MKSAFPMFFGLLFVSFVSLCQKTPTPYTLETVPDSLCYRFGKNLDHPERYIAAKLTAEEMPQWEPKNFSSFLSQFTSLQLLRITGRSEIGYEEIIYTNKIIGLTEFETDRFLLEIPYKATTTFINNNPNLRVLRFATSIDSIPDNIGSLTNLEVLEIAVSPNKGKPIYLPATMKKLTRIHTLVLSLNKTDIGKDHPIWTLPKLENLAISGCGHVEWPLFPATLKRVRINNSQTMTMGEFPEGNQLEILCIDGTMKAKTNFPRSFENLVHLRGLRLSNINSDQTPDVNKFQHLTFLDYSIDGKYDLRQIIKIPSLEYFYFVNATDAIPHLPLEITPNLKVIDVHLGLLVDLPEAVYTSKNIECVFISSFSFPEGERIRLLNSDIQYLNIFEVDLSPKNRKKYQQEIHNSYTPDDYIPPSLVAFESQFSFQFMPPTIFGH